MKGVPLLKQLIMPPNVTDFRRVISVFKMTSHQHPLYNPFAGPTTSHNLSMLTPAPKYASSSGYHETVHLLRQNLLRSWRRLDPLRPQHHGATEASWPTLQPTCAQSSLNGQGEDFSTPYTESTNDGKGIVLCDH